MALLAQIAEIEEDAFLAGPERCAAWEGSGGDLIVVDRHFGKSLEQVLKDAAESDAEGLSPEDGEPVSPSLAVPGYSFTKVWSGVLLHAPDGTVAGAYVGPDVAVADAHRGMGLGAELVVERYLRDGGSLPAWDLQDAGYSPAGEACHRAAWRLLRNKNYAMRKAAAVGIEAPAAPTP
jgi:GNAT superfamily N-acetyltransferase